jgi:5-formyltetrahydrofolate cyclo-ligase
MTKAELRALVRDRAHREIRTATDGTDGVGGGAIGAVAEALLARLQTLAAWRDARRPCVYVSLPDEAPTDAILESCFATGAVVCVPRVVGDALALHLVRSRAELAVGAFGILEPSADVPECPPDGTDCVIIPGLAFDATGGRVGRGKGFYDRFLAHVPARMPRIALAREWQIFPSVPSDAHDARMNWIVTPERTIFCA